MIIKFDSMEEKELPSFYGGEGGFKGEYVRR